MGGPLWPGNRARPRWDSGAGGPAGNRSGNRFRVCGELESRLRPQRGAGDAFAAPPPSPPAARNSPELHVVLCLPEGEFRDCGGCTLAEFFLGAGVEGS